MSSPHWNAPLKPLPCWTFGALPAATWAHYLLQGRERLCSLVPDLAAFAYFERQASSSAFRALSSFSSAAIRTSRGLGMNTLWMLSAGMVMRLPMLVP